MQTLRRFEIPLCALAALAAPVWAFAVFGAALWANIYVDGHPDASTADVIGGIFPTLAPFLAVVVGVVVVGRLMGTRTVENAFGILAIAFLPGLTFGYAIPALAAAYLPFLARDLVTKRRLGVPPFDVVALAGGGLLILFWAYAESHR